jgi:two-component system, LuxR family, sensor kinase FixL
MGEFLGRLFSSDFMPHGHCYLWRPEILWLHVFSDGVITTAYYFIPLALVYFVRKRKDLPFNWMFLLFGVFIFACGTTHLMEIWTVWNGTYRLAGVIKAITAVASVGTALALVPLIPQALALPSPAQLRAANAKLEEEVRERLQAEAALEEARSELETKVQERTAELAESIEALLAEIAERKRAEEESRKLASLVENSTDFIGVASLDGKATFVNGSGQAMVGLESDDEAQVEILEYLPPEDRDWFQQHILPALQRDGTWEGETRFRHFKTDATIPMLQHIFFLKEPVTNRRLALATISRDISQRKRAEEALQKAQTDLAHVTRVSTMGEMAASIAHEVNQPLAAIVTNGNASLHLLPKDVAGLEDVREAIDCMISDAMRASEVIKRIRATLKNAAPEKIPLNLNETIQETLALAAGELARSQVQVRTKLTASSQPVLGDRVQLQQVMLNLILNGKESMSRPGWQQRDLVISTENTRPDEITVAVRDSGPGLDPQDQERLFDTFFTTKKDGIGLGLSISRTIVEAHGGRLWATTNEEAGATFQFTVPTSHGS